MTDWCAWRPDAIFIYDIGDFYSGSTFFSHYKTMNTMKTNVFQSSALLFSTADGICGLLKALTSAKGHKSTVKCTSNLTKYRINETNYLTWWHSSDLQNICLVADECNICSVPGSENLIPGKPIAKKIRAPSPDCI